MGIKSDITNYYSPGEKVEVYARVNKKNDVIYEWNIPGEWTEIAIGKVQWKIPSENGTYEVNVNVVDSKTKETASKKMEITVSDSAVCAIPETFSCKTKTTVYLKNRMIGNKKYITESVINMNSDGSVQVETIESNGEVTRTYADSEALYSVDEKGNRTFVTKCNSGKSIPQANIVSLDLLKNSCDSWEQKGRNYKFLQENNEEKVLVEYDSVLGIVTRLREETVDNTSVSDITMTYDVINGFITPTKISGTIVQYMSGEKFETLVEEEITDIVINGEIEL